MPDTLQRSIPREDRRSRRTRQTLQQALRELMMEQRYDQITVQDIIDRANVGRSTFYSHYLDKDDLLRSEIEELLSRFARRMEDDAKTARLLPSLELLQHFRDSHALIRALVRGRAMEPVLKTMHSQLSSQIEARLRGLMGTSTSPQVPVSLVANYVAGTLLMLFQWWLDRDMLESAEQLNAYFLDLVRPSVRAATGVDL
jgi:AcrR family transcriptional regulator